MRSGRPPITISDSEKTNLESEIKSRIAIILDSVQKLLDNGGDIRVCGALYTHAFEEYGKYRLVKNTQSQNGQCNINMNNFTCHDTKIEVAQQNLPPACYNLNQGGFTKSGFTRSGFQVHEVVDWETRLTIFNTDLENGRVKTVPNIDSTTLQTAINQFRSCL